MQNFSTKLEKVIEHVGACSSDVENISCRKYLGGAGSGQHRAHPEDQQYVYLLAAQADIMSEDTTEIALTEAGCQLATITTGHAIKRRPLR